MHMSMPQDKHYLLVLRKEKNSKWLFHPNVAASMGMSGGIGRSLIKPSQVNNKELAVACCLPVGAQES